MKAALISFFVATAASGQSLILPPPPEITGRIVGEVLDAVTHQPLSNTRVSLHIAYPLPYEGPPKVATTDSSGRFHFDGMRGGGYYQLYFTHYGYSNTDTARVRKLVEGSPGSVSEVKLEMVPAVSVAGHIVDEDGGPLKGCTLAVSSTDIFGSGKGAQP